MKLAVNFIKARSAMNKSKIYGVQYSLNPYRGCQHACRYCYAELITKKAGKLERWGSYVDVKENFVEILEREVERIRRGLVMVSSVTDPYQPMESRTFLTRKCLEILKKHDFPAFVLTKSPLVLRDKEIFTNFGNCEVGITITTDDDKIRKVFEPFAPPVESRVMALKKLREAGVKTFAFIGPLLPMNPQKLLRMIENSVEYIYIDKMNYSFKVSSIYKREGLMKFIDDEYFLEILDFFSSNFENVINCMD